MSLQTTDYELQTSAAQTSIALLAGGRSRRMGRDKARIVVDGDEPLLERTARVAKEAGCRVVVVGRGRPDDWGGEEIPFLPDDDPGLGPLGGLVTALRTCDGSVFLLPCDLPRLRVEALSWIVEHLATDPGRHGTALYRADCIEPTLSLYRPAILTDFPDLLTSDDRSLRGLIERGEFGRVDLPARFDEDLFNANRPGDLVGG